MEAYLIGERTGGMTAVEIFDEAGKLVWAHIYFTEGCTVEGYERGLKQVIDDMYECAFVEDYEGGNWDEDGNAIAVDDSDTTDWIAMYDQSADIWVLNDGFRTLGQSTEIADALMMAGLVPTDIEHEDHFSKLVSSLCDHVKTYMSPLSFKSIEWNDDLVGFVIQLSNGKPLQVQFEKETNRLHADYGRYGAIIDKVNEYGLDLTCEEELEVRNLIKDNQEIRAKEIELDELNS